MAAVAYDVAALALKGQDAELNFPNSAPSLPVPATTSPRDIQAAAASAAAAIGAAAAAMGAGAAPAKDGGNNNNSGGNIHRQDLVVDHEERGVYNHHEYVDEDLIFNMPNVLVNMAEGMLLSPPRLDIAGDDDDDRNYYVVINGEIVLSTFRDSDPSVLLHLSKHSLLQARTLLEVCNSNSTIQNMGIISLARVLESDHKALARSTTFYIYTTTRSIEYCLNSTTYSFVSSLEPSCLTYLEFVVNKDLYDFLTMLYYQIGEVGDYQVFYNTFDIDIEDEKIQKVIDGQMQRAWRGHKYKLHDHFKKVGGEIDPTKAKNECPRGEVSLQDWEYLCDRWSEPSFLKNADSRSKRKWDSRNGSKSTARHHISRGVDLDASIGHIETWRLRHWHKENGWETLELKDTYEKNDTVLGRHSVRLFGWGRSPNISETTSTSSDPDRPSYSRLMELYLDLRGQLDTMRQALIAKEIMLPSTNTHASDHSSGPSMNPTPFRNNQDTPCQPSSEFMGENV
ncbi:hypothetical protein G4B88_000189 [Cannabis sativa]|uniref:AP2/ERF domain-containing protein n=1 Tax=Cannabis sativa TaxID=3483 RepID=A0A7J6GPE6_CANSA|nr:hypothetical protein G4B88_000189 [Cannabis sativa]